MANIPKVLSNFEDALASKISSAAASATLVSGTDNEGVTLSGRYGLTIDEGSVNEEHVLADITGTAVTFVTRGVSSSDWQTEVSGNKKAHSRGASVKITNYPVLGALRDMLNGDDELPNPVGLAATAATPSNRQFATVAQVNSILTGSVGSASESSAGTTKVSVAPATPGNPIAVGDNDPRVPTADENNALAGGGIFGSPATGNKFLTQDGQANQLVIAAPEETTSGILASSPVFIQSDGEATKTATVKTFISTSNWPGVVDTSVSTGSIQAIHVAWLTGSRFVVSWDEYNSASDIEYMVAVGNISDDGQVSIWSTTRVTNDTASAQNNTLGVYRLSDSLFVYAWKEAATSITLYACSVSADNVITVGSSQSAGAVEDSYFGFSRLSDTSFVFTYKEATSDDCYVTAGSVSGTTISLGTPIAVDPNASSYMNIVALTSTKAAVVWQTGTSLRSEIVTIAGTVVTAVGTETEITNVGTTYMKLARLADDKFAVFYLITTGADPAIAICTVNGSNVITAGTPVTVVDGTVAVAADMIPYGTNSVIIFYQTSNSYPLYATSISYVTVSGTVPTIANTIQITNIQQASTGYHSLMTLVNGFLLVVNNFGVAYQMKETIYSFKPIFNEVFAGVAKSAPVSGSVPIINKGRTGSIFSGLTFGKKYFYNQDGTYGEQGLIPIGTAISSTEILLD